MSDMEDSMATNQSRRSWVAENGAMTREQLRVVLSEWFCGCGSPEAACGALLRLLSFHPMYEHWRNAQAWVGNEGLLYLLLYQLDRLELTEHGGSVGGAWLTPKGEAVRDALAREQADGFETLNGEYCVHGYDISDGSHDCMKADE